MFWTEAPLCSAAPHWGFVQFVVAVLAVPLHSDCPRFNRRRPTERLPDARHGKWQDRDSTTGDCVFLSVTPDGSTRHSGIHWQAWRVIQKSVPVLQFFSWFARLQNNMDQDENVKYRWAENPPFLLLMCVWILNLCLIRMRLPKCLGDIVLLFKTKVK